MIFDVAFLHFYSGRERSCFRISIFISIDLAPVSIDKFILLRPVYNISYFQTIKDILPCLFIFLSFFKRAVSF